MCLAYKKHNKKDPLTSISNDVYENLCSNKHDNATLEPMFNFQGGDRINCGYWDCFAMQESYAKEVASYGFEFSAKALNEIK